MMWGFTARKRTSVLFTVSLLLVVKFTPNFCTNGLLLVVLQTGKIHIHNYTESLMECSTNITDYAPVVAALWGDLCLENWL